MGDTVWAIEAILSFLIACTLVSNVISVYFRIPAVNLQKMTISWGTAGVN